MNLKNTNKKEFAFEIMAILLIILFAISITPKTLQNDTFYTIKIGELITKNGIDMQEHFSWHTELEYTYPHWLYDVGMYTIYNFGETIAVGGGWTAIYISTCVLAAILGIAIYKVNSKLSKNKIISFITTIGVLYLLKGYIAARAQLVTFILFILLIYNIEKFLQNKNLKNVIALFIIHILIANLHVAVWPFSFVLYLPYIAEYLICEIAELALYKKVSISRLKRKIKNLEQKINDLENIKQVNIKIDSKKKEINEKSSIESLKEKLELYREKLKNVQLKAEKIKNKREENLKNPYKIKMNKNNNVRWLIVIMLIALLTGFATPLGTTPYTYTIYTMQGNTMDNINEHLPLTLINNTPILCTIVIILALITFTTAKIKLSDLFMIGGLTYLMFMSRRQTSMFALVGSVVFVRTLTNFIYQYVDCKPEDFVKKYMNKFIAFILAAIVILLSINFYKDIKDDEYVSKKSYPVDACDWILENLDVQNIRLYNEYNYGSYLLYRGIPVFIDSRADLYTPEFNKSLGENSIFNDFLNSSNIGTYYGKIFEKYGITHIIVYENSKINMLIKNADSEKYNLLYSDDYFVIYEVLEY